MVKEMVKDETDIKEGIKDRIEKIKQGIVPEGYKKTAIGIIPNNWGIKKFGDLVIRSSERFYPDQNDQSFKCIELEHINSETGTINGYIRSQFIKSTKIIFRKNDILYGRLRPYLKKYYYAKFSGICSTEIWVLKPLQKNLKPKYLFYLIQTNYFNYNANISTGSSMPRADWGYVSNINYSVPPIQEQQKIADILSTWDRAIELKEYLIKEKEEQKKGLKQKLISDKFNYLLKRVKIADILDYEQPNKYLASSISEEGVIPVLTANKSFVLGYTNEKDGIYNNFPVIIFDDFTTEKKYVNFPFKIRSSAIKILRLKDPDIADLRYVYEQMTLIKFPRGGHKRHYISEYQFINIKIPPLSEQKRIVTILSTADKEIELLKKEVKQLKEQKKGLMQLLLTGIVRVGEVEQIE